MTIEKTEIYENYLPAIVKETKQFQKLAEIEGPILWQEKQVMNDLIKDQWIQTATEKGLTRRGYLLGIFRNPQEPLERFRARVLYRWNEHIPYTYYSMVDWLDGLCGKQNYKCNLVYNDYLLEVILELQRKELQEEIIYTLRKMVPANMVISVTLNYNKYGEFKIVTHGLLKELHLSQQNMRDTFIQQIHPDLVVD